MPVNQKSFNLILGDQLFDDIGALPPGPIVMVEDRIVASAHRYHSHKLVMTFSSMRHFALRHGSRVAYHPLDEGSSIPKALSERRSAGFTAVHCYEPADEAFGRQLGSWCSDSGLELNLWPNPMFLTTAHEWSAFTGSGDRRLMADFYRYQRLRLGLLLDSQGRPVGGRWSFDPENRKGLPRGHLAPPAALPEPDAITREVGSLVERYFPEHAGDPGLFRLPVTHADARSFLSDFLAYRLDRFGDYEDAISSDQHVLYHSLLSPMMNVGLLTPRQVIDAAIQRHAREPVPLNSLEGFVRQIVGWREFVRGIHRERRWEGSASGSRILGPDWFSGTTGLPPLDSAIRRAIGTGWCHHIERLMVLGAAMFMCDVRAAEAYRFFMEMFVDAAEWVMEPNVYGMSQFVAPTFATKPYFSGSAYLLKMSDFPRGEWCEVWDGLYWSTVQRMRKQLTGNPRMSPILRAFDKLDPVRRDRVIARAEKFKDRTTTRN